MTLAVMSGVGPAVISRYEQGSSPGERWNTFFTLGTATFNPGITTADLMSPDGTLANRITTGSMPSLSLEVAGERYPSITGGSLLARITEGVATTSPTAHIRKIYQRGSSLLARTDAQAIIDGLTLAGGTRTGVYELNVSIDTGPAVSVAIRRISSPANVAPEALFSNWAAGTPDTLVAASPTVGDSGVYIVQVEAAVIDSVSADLSFPTIYHYDVSVWSADDGSNTRAWDRDGSVRPLRRGGPDDGAGSAVFLDLELHGSGRAGSGPHRAVRPDDHCWRSGLKCGSPVETQIPDARQI